MSRKKPMIAVRWKTPTNERQIQLFASWKDAEFFAELLRRKGRRVMVGEIAALNGGKR